LLLKGEGKPASFLHVSVLFDSAKAIRNRAPIDYVRSGTAPLSELPHPDDAVRSPQTPRRPPISKLNTSISTTIEDIEAALAALSFFRIS